MSRLQPQSHNHGAKAQGTFKCGTCGTRCDLFDQLSQHYYQLHQMRYLCSYCWQQSYSYQDSNKHEQKEHKDRKWYPCRFCSNEYLSPKEQQRHMESAHSSQPPFNCNLCGVPTFSIYGYELHQRKSHSRGKKRTSFFCHKCYEVFLDRSEHFRHMYEKHQATLTCQFCDYHVFDHENESEILSGQHLAKHREKQFWFCAICSEQFKTEREVRTHWSSHESISTNFCRECDMLMPSETCLRLHRSYWHPEKLVQASSGNRIVFEFSEVGTETARKLVGPDRRVSFLPDPSLETSSMDPLTITPASKSRPTGFPTLSLNGASSNAEFIAAAVPAIVPKTEIVDEPDTTTLDEPESSVARSFRMSDISSTSEGSTDEDEEETCRQVITMKNRQKPLSPKKPQESKQKRQLEAKDREEPSKRRAIDSVNKPVKTTSVIRPIRPTLGVKKQPIPVENVPSETEKDEENEDYTRIPLVTESAKALRAVLNHPRFSSNSSSNLSESSSDEGPSKRIRIVSETSSRTTEVTKKVSSGGNQPVLTSKTNCKTSQLVMIRNTNTTNNPESSMMSLQYKCKLCAKMSTVYRNNIERHLRTIHNVVRSDRKEYDDFITNVLLPTPSGGTDHSETERSDATVCNVATTSGSKNCSGPHVNCQHCAKRKKAAQKLRDEVNDAIKPLQLLLKQIEKFC